MKLKLLVASACAVIALSATANAATVSITEGNRAQVSGSTPLPDAGSANISLGSIGAGGHFAVHGADGGGADAYVFTTTAASSSVNFIFDDLPLVNTGTYTNAGLFTPDVLSKVMTFRLIDVAGSSPVLLSTAVFTGNVLDAAANTANPGTSLIFGDIDPGSYRLRIVSGSAEPTTYDFSVAGEASPIPLPASALLLLGAVGGLGFASRRKKA